MDCSTLSFIVVTFGVIYLYIRYAFGYWSRRGVKSISGTFPFGNLGPALMQKVSMGELAEQFYRSTTERFIGIYSFLRPVLVLRDPEVIRNVLVKDFQHFHDRGVHSDEKRDPLSAHLFALNGEQWKNLRIKLSPTFTSGKMKAMFSTLVDCGSPLERYLESIANGERIADMREVAARFSTNVIASIAFGNDINCIDNPNTSFRRYGRKVFDLNVKNGIRFFLSSMAPSIMKLLRIRTQDRDVEDFMRSLVEKTLNFREKSNVVRKDFFQLLVQLRNTGNVQLDDKWETVISNDEKFKALTIDQVTAQAFVFFLAGFETSATTMSFCLYEMARHPEIQRKAQEEIEQVLARHKGQVTYESVSEMKYLEYCIDETLRLYPPVPVLTRICTKEYQIPNSNITIEKGTLVFIPVFALQRDEQYYVRPKEFMPERFTPENMAGKTFNTTPNLAFGEGPRVCIGLRLGMLQTKVGLISMMKKFSFALSAQLRGKELFMSPKALLLAPEGGIELEVTKRS